jgi:hypothetical protein
MLPLISRVSVYALLGRIKSTDFIVSFRPKLSFFGFLLGDVGRVEVLGRIWEVALRSSFEVVECWGFGGGVGVGVGV